MKKEREELKEFVEGLEMTVLSEEDAVLLEGMVGTSQPEVVNNCICAGNNCQCRGNNCNCY